MTQIKKCLWKPVTDKTRYPEGNLKMCDECSGYNVSCHIYSPENINISRQQKRSPTGLERFLLRREKTKILKTRVCLPSF